ncbi:hypothetical protein ABBQ38_001370 [Trebouxia sp. C0009 RCD-2024]
MSSARDNRGKPFYRRLTSKPYSIGPIPGFWSRTAAGQGEALLAAADVECGDKAATDFCELLQIRPAAFHGSSCGCVLGAPLGRGAYGDPTLGEQLPQPMAKSVYGHTA